MKSPARKNPRSTTAPKPVARPPTRKPARASQLRAQTRKLLGKHYRAKYGVR